MKLRRNTYIVLMLVLMCILFVGCQEKKNEEGYRSIKVVETSGEVIVKRNDVGDLNAYVDMKLEDKDIIEVKENSYLRLLLDDDKYVYVESNSYFTLEASGTTENSKTKIHLEKGAILNEIQKTLSDDSSYEISTPNSTMSVRGTVYYVEVSFDSNNVSHTNLKVFDGVVGTQLIYNGELKGEEVKVEKNYELTVEGNKDSSAFVLHDNSILDEIDISDLKIETLENLLKVNQEIKPLCISKDELQSSLEIKKEQSYQDDQTTDQNVPPIPRVETNIKNYNIILIDGNNQRYSMHVAENGSVDLPVLKRAGYSFDGWYTTSSYENEFVSKKMPSKNIELYAKWSPLESAVQLEDSYLTNNDLRGLVDTIVALPTPQREGYTFDGWYEDREYRNQVSELKYLPSIQTVYAKWEKNNYVLTMNNTFSPLQPLVYNYQDNIVLPSVTREGYSFLGWYNDVDFNDRFDQTTMPSHNVSLFAKWAAQQRVVTYKDTYTDLTTQAFDVDSNVELPVLIRDGYIFEGWYKDETYQNKVSSMVMPTTDVTIYAKWTARDDITYTINNFILKEDSTEYELANTTVYNDGTPLKVITPKTEITYDSSIYLLRSDLTSKKYTIKNDGSLVINLYYIDKKQTNYVVTFKRVDNTEDIVYCDKNEKVLSLPKPTVKEGFTFRGWNTKANGSGDYLTERYIVTSHVVIYEIQYDYVPYKVKYEMQTLDNNTLDYEEVASIDLKGRPNTKPALDKLIPDRTLITNDYLIEYPENIEDININGTSSYTIKIKYNGELSRVNYKLLNNSIVSKYYKKNSQFIGLESSQLNNNFGYWKNKDLTTINYFSSITTSYDNEEVYEYTVLNTGDIVSPNQRISDIKIEDPSHYFIPTLKHSYTYMANDDNPYIAGPYFGYYYFGMTPGYTPTRIRIYDVTYKINKFTLYQNLNAPESATIDGSPSAKSIGRGITVNLANPLDYVTTSDYLFKGWRLIKDGKSVDDCFVTGFRGCFGNINLKAEWQKK